MSPSLKFSRAWGIKKCTRQLIGGALESRSRLPPHRSQVLELKEVCFTIQKDGEPVHLVNHASLVVPRGHYMAIVGPSGCGKTTLLKTIAGLNPESEGSLWWAGRDLSKEGDLEPWEIGYVPQFSIAYDELTADEAVETATRLRVRSPSLEDLDRRIDRVLEETGLAPIADRHVKVLSGGQKRRLGLAMELVSERLKRAISLRCISDAPIGVALSGGVDSSLITYLMREVYSSEIRTYSVVFEEKEQEGREIDESRYSNFVSAACGTTHTRILLSSEMFSDHYLHAAWLNDEPLNYPNSIGIHLLSKYAAKDVKVLLGGEGADETYAGYGYFTENFGAMLQQFAREEDAQSLIAGPYVNTFRENLLAKWGSDTINGKISIATRTYLVSTLNRLDKMSMGASLEFRTPFLDLHVASSSRNMSDELRLSSDGITKVVLKNLAKKYMPDDYLLRPKVGFSTPLNQWLHDRNHIGRYVDILDEERTLSRPHFNRAGIQKLLADFRTGNDTFTFSLAGRVWILLNLELWTRMMLEDKCPLN